MNRSLLVLPLLLLLASCAAKRDGSVNLAELLNIANSARNITKIASSTDLEAAANAMLAITSASSGNATQCSWHRI